MLQNLMTVAILIENMSYVFGNDVKVMDLFSFYITLIMKFLNYHNGNDMPTSLRNLD